MIASFPLLFFLGLAVLLAVLTTPGTIYLLVLSIAGVMPIRKLMFESSPLTSETLNIVLLVQAHNESQGIGRTVANLFALAKADGSASVVVIADNCSDDTATVAAAFGARVLVRHNEVDRGKGFALDFAFKTLAKEGVDAYIVIDADSLAEENLLTTIRAQFKSGAQAIQTRYTVLNIDGSPRTKLAELALCAFNCLRPRGRYRLHLSVGILGNGFALRQAVLDKVPYTASSVVEDLEYHLKLIDQGVIVQFADETVVKGDMPVSGVAQGTQRARWEGGRLRMLIDHGGSLAYKILQGKLRFLDPLLDLILLPLAQHTILLVLLFLMPFYWAKTLALFGLCVLVFHVIAASRVGGISFPALIGIFLLIPKYLFWKIMMLRSTVRTSKTTTQWIRTDRDNQK